MRSGIEFFHRIVTPYIMKREAGMEFTSLTFVDQTANLGRENLIKLTNRTDKLLYNTPKDELHRFLGKSGVSSADA